MKILKPLLGSRMTQSRVHQNFWLPVQKMRGAVPLDLVAVAMVRNEARYIREWIEFHRLMGFQKFLIYENGSTDGTVAILENYRQEDIVEIIPWPHFLEGFGTQAMAYAHALAHIGPRTHWIAFFDVDEYMFSPQGNTISDVLKEYDDLPTLVVFWLMFGTSGRSVPGPGLLIEDYTMRAPIPSAPVRDTLLANYKSIVKPAEVIGNKGAHHFLLDKSGLTGFDECRRPIHLNRKKQVTADKIRINHYYTKSKADWEQRRGRKTGTGAVLRDDFLDAAFAKVERNAVEDITILQHLGELKAALSHHT